MRQVVLPAAHWPTAAGDYTAFMNNLPKVVFSTTLLTADWAGSRIAHGGLAAEIAALKSESGGEIIAHGGAAFVQALSRLGLIDEYRLVILPVALGNGLPLFKDLAKPLRVDLAEARSFPDGTVIYVCRPIRATAAVYRAAHRDLHPSHRRRGADLSAERPAFRSDEIVPE
jgi:dihydrofolate reductase